MTDYTKLTLVELEAEEAALDLALREARRAAALETLMAIDGPLYGEGEDYDSPRKRNVEGQVWRSPYWITDADTGAEIDGFDGQHSLSDIARWIIGESRTDGEELMRILGEMLEAQNV
jgi:hypothetical protein